MDPNLERFGPEIVADIAKIVAALPSWLNLRTMKYSDRELFVEDGEAMNLIDLLIEIARKNVEEKVKAIASELTEYDRQIVISYLHERAAEECFRESHFYRRLRNDENHFEEMFRSADNEHNRDGGNVDDVAA